MVKAHLTVAIYGVAGEACMLDQGARHSHIDQPTTVAWH